MFWKLIRGFKPVFRPLLELYFRVLDRIKLILLFLRGHSTVERIVNGDDPLKDKVLVYATYPSGRILPLHVELIDKFCSAGYSVIIISNNRRMEKSFIEYLDRPWTYMIRRPFGRDFGCYRDAVLRIYSKIEHDKIDLDRVVFLNDSIVITKSSINEVFKFFDESNEDFTGLTENYNFVHHVGSFAMGVSGSALCHPLVRRYWERFTPISTRKYCIERGELGFSRIMKRAGYPATVLWTLAHMKRSLEQLNIEGLWDICAAMEKGYRDRSPSAIDLTDSKLMRFSYMRAEPQRPEHKFGRKERLQRRYLPDGEKWNSSEINGHASKDDPIDLFNLREQILGISDKRQREIVLKNTKGELVNGLVAYAFRGSQVHHAAPLLFYIGAGIVKKDLIYRRIIDPYDMARLLVNSKLCEADEALLIEKEVLEKGHPYSLRGKMRLFYEWDFI